MLDQCTILTSQIGNLSVIVSSTTHSSLFFPLILKFLWTWSFFYCPLNCLNFIHLSKVSFLPCFFIEDAVCFFLKVTNLISFFHSADEPRYFIYPLYITFCLNLLNLSSNDFSAQWTIKGLLFLYDPRAVLKVLV